VGGGGIWPSNTRSRSARNSVRYDGLPAKNTTQRTRSLTAGALSMTGLAVLFERNRKGPNSAAARIRLHAHNPQTDDYWYMCYDIRRRTRGIFCTPGAH